MNPQIEIDMLKAHLALCAQLFRSTAEAMGVDLNETALAIKAIKDGEQQGSSVSIGSMLDKWDAIAK